MEIESATSWWPVSHLAHHLTLGSWMVRASHRSPQGCGFGSPLGLSNRCSELWARRTYICHPWYLQVPTRVTYISSLFSCSVAVIPEYNPHTGLDVLKVQPVSMAQARQRLGRAGRQCPGHCYRLYTEEQFYGLRDTTTPEIQRCNLSNVVLQLLALGIKDIANFDFLDAPSPKAIENALELLHLLGALDGTRKEVMKRDMSISAQHKTR